MTAVTSDFLQHNYIGSGPLSGTTAKSADKRLYGSTRPPAPSELPYVNPHGPTPGALQGDQYPLVYDQDGYPELPACLDHRTKPEPIKSAEAG